MQNLNGSVLCHSGQHGGQRCAWFILGILLLFIFKICEQESQLRFSFFFFLQSNLLASGANDSEIFIWDLNNFSVPMTPGTKSQVNEFSSGHTSAVLYLSRQDKKMCLETS